MAFVILKDDHPTLLEKCKLVSAVPSADFFKSMFSTMLQSGGIGLSANQIGIKQRFFIMKVDKPIIFVNPRIKKYFGKRIEGEEGCLSFPGHHEMKGRYQKILVEFVDASGMLRKREFTGMEAVVIQHEIDHLNGIPFKSVEQSQ